MSRYTPLVTFETEFEGDTVKMQLKQLRRETFLSWMPYLKNTREVGRDDKGKPIMSMDEESSLKLVNEAASILPQHVLDFRGLKDSDGNAVQLETVIEEIYFMQLVSAIVGKLIDIAQVSEGQQGNSAGPQPAP